MEQFVLVPASAYNKTLKTKSFTTQYLPEYQALQNTTYQIDSRKKETSKILFARADSLVDKLSSFPRITLSHSHALIVDVVETGVLLSDFGQKLGRKTADVPDIYSTLPDAAGTCPALVLNQNAKIKE